MKLIKFAVVGAVLTIGGLIASNAALATESTPTPPRPVIIVIVDDDGYRTTIVCNPKCEVQDQYWQGKAK